MRSFTEDNVAFQKNAEADNVQENKPHFGPAMALDDDPETYWATDDGVLSSQIYIDLEE